MKKRIVLVLFIMCLLLVGCSKKEILSDNKNVKLYEHAFSVGEDKQVYFAKSNLQYNPKQKIWKFADNAYDFIGDDNKNISDDYDGYIDLFSWGSTGYKLSPTYFDYDSSMFGNGNYDISNTQYDFGIYLKDILNDEYRMFTHDEIHYLLMYRKNAVNLFGYSTINQIKGLIILPDDWKNIDDIEFTPSINKGLTNQYNWYYTLGDNDNYNYNNFTIEQWNKLEENGAIFLPASGMRYDTEISHVDISGHYWTSSHYGSDFANCLCLFEKDLFLEGNFDRNYGLSIRLVKDIK